MRKTHSYQWLEAACAPEATNPEAGHTPTLSHLLAWAARYSTGLLIKLMPKGVVFSFLLFDLLDQECTSADLAKHQV